MKIAGDFKKICVVCGKEYPHNENGIRTGKKCYACWRKHQTKAQDEKRKLSPPDENKKRKGRENSKKTREKYLDAYREKNRMRTAEWRKSHLEEFREKHRINVNNRRSKEIGNGGRISPQEWKQLCDFYGNRCLRCGEKRKLTVDHIIPVSKGGSGSIDNIQPLCMKCNQEKHAKTIDYRTKNISMAQLHLFGEIKS